MFAVSETWLTPSTFDNEIIPTDYHIVRKDRDGRGGGVLLALFHFTLIPSPSSVEVLSVSLYLPARLIIIISVVYIPPCSDQLYFDSLLSHLRSLLDLGSPLFILGDFNCPDIDWSTLSAKSSSSMSVILFLTTICLKLSINPLILVNTYWTLL